MTKNRKKIKLLLIDPQRGFMDINVKDEYKNFPLLKDYIKELYVDGADEDAKRIAGLIRRGGKEITSITVTLDSHHVNHIANYTSWLILDSNNRWVHPDPFTLVPPEDIESGKIRTRNPALNAYALYYTKALRDNKRYVLCLWPLHCLIGSPGYDIEKNIYAALVEWEIEYGRHVIKVTKGSNYKTEHYSAAMADVPDPQDPTTSLNKNLIDDLENYDEILIAGEASSHCVANTVMDIANHISEEAVKKFIFLEDGSSPVQGFENLETEFIDQMKVKGMKVLKTTEYQF